MRSCAWPLVAVVSAALTIPVGSQTQIQIRGCTKQGIQYSCDKPAFRRVLQAAKTISIGPRNLDQASKQEMAKLVSSLGKTSRSGSADLMFVLERSESEGIYFGPDSRELATIRVFNRGSQGAPADLLWVESYVGQPNTPWPIVVYDTIQQFKADLR